VVSVTESEALAVLRGFVNGPGVAMTMREGLDWE
jgi:hypothetical protein